MSDLPRITGRWRFSAAAVVTDWNWRGRPKDWEAGLIVEVEEVRRPSYPRAPIGEVTVWRRARGFEARYLKPENEVRP
ncbi:hypothetical protein AA309_19935 [Microvirga vignae]|uniref:Uncharacterized protein n=1 Tax=Microvirga vignae TaxID=1225564 RepID=A0A0H1R8K0_9HYPH|nr:hypothetical protein [Microvirga vignae]KLK91374.1 hypothetical protein AA309_19935 [Microvirga vignae]